jgi:hypothetical protein
MILLDMPYLGLTFSENPKPSPPDYSIYFIVAFILIICIIGLFSAFYEKFILNPKGKKLDKNFKIVPLNQ